jgi:uncharacterized membrane protein YraQ (UPF0718 family)
MEYILLQIGQALLMSFNMFWEILWALALGFAISAGVQAVVSKSEMSKLLPDASLKSLSIAAGLGAASSSCSYAAVAISRSLFQKGANFTASMAFEFASTNLVIELGILLALLIGWQFTLAEFIGGIIMIGVLALLFRMFLKPRLVEEARKQAEKGIAGKMEGHANMDMSVSGGSIWHRLFSTEGITAISHFYVMDIVAVWKDIVIGLLIAGALSAWVPNSFWQSFFLAGKPGLLPIVWGALIGPLVAIASFVCSLWNGGISFSGVIAFIFADLLIPPILNIYRKYYGKRMTVFLFFTSYVAMVIGALITELLFYPLGLVPTQRTAVFSQATLQLNYTMVLNVIFLAASIWLLVRFMKNGGPHMLKMMGATKPQH